MAPTKLPTTNRYIPPGVRKYYYEPAIATQSAPTRTEINAGVDLTDQVADVSGFTVTSDQTETPDLASRFTGKIPGRITADDSSLTFYASSTGNDVRLVLPRDTAGFVIVLPEGDVPGQRMDVFPIKVSATAVDGSVEDPGRVIVNFSITSIPSQNVVIPA